ncbi:MAG: hypothetical protein AAGF95_06155 [Chloroflexota bacterium]
MTTHASSEQPDDDLSLLSAYIDGTTTDAERIALEKRLQREPALQQELSELRVTISLLHDLPPVTPPRSFTIDPATVQPKSWWLTTASWLQLGSALAAVMLALTITFELVAQGQLSGGAGGSETIAEEVLPQDTAMEAAEAPADEEAPVAEDAMEEEDAAEVLPMEEAAVETTEEGAADTVLEEAASEPALEEAAEGTALEEEGTTDAAIQESEAPPIAPDSASSQQDDGASIGIEMPAEAPPAEEAPEEQQQQVDEDTVIAQDAPEEPERAGVSPDTATIAEGESAQREQFGSTSSSPNPLLRIVQIVLAVLAVVLGVAAWRVTRQQSR